jgi:hypothetical protein
MWIESALQEGIAVGWMTKELSINFWQGKLFFSSSKYPDNIRGQPRLLLFSLYSG